MCPSSSGWSLDANLSIEDERGLEWYSFVRLRKLGILWECLDCVSPLFVIVLRLSHLDKFTGHRILLCKVHTKSCHSHCADADYFQGNCPRRLHCLPSNKLSFRLDGSPKRILRSPPDPFVAKDFMRLC